MKFMKLYIFMFSCFRLSQKQIIINKIEKMTSHFEERKVHYPNPHGKLF